MDLMPPALDPRRAARALYWMGWPLAEAARHLDQPEATVRSWCARDGWNKAAAIDRVEATLEQRLVQLIAKPIKTGADFKEIDLLGRQVERLARVRRYEAPGGHAADLNPNLERQNAGPKRKPTRNAFTDEQAAQLVARFEELRYAYQDDWWAARVHRTREVLKSRQIGATFYFANEALVEAVTEGRNKVFLSASRAQAHIFRNYIVEAAKEVGVDLVGDPIVLANGASLMFLGTNYRTAQGHSGDLYFDEFMWTFGFAELNKVASAMATLSHWRKTYFSTPSSITHEGHAFWSGAAWNKRRTKADRREFELTHAALAGGAVGPDGVWRQIVTVEDAVRRGNGALDVEQLRGEYGPDEFANLFLCEFVDDALSVFPLAELQRCLVDTWAEWEDFAPQQDRPLGRQPVGIGYDPAATGDTAALVVGAHPPRPGQGKFRLLKKEQFRGLDFLAQAEAIRAYTLRYNVVDIAIDATGVGLAVLQLVKEFFPLARGITYSPETKTRMVLKATDTVRRGRLEYDAGWSDLTQALMAVRREMTASGRAMTYAAGRDENGHADLAWATFHLLDHEPLEVAIGGGRTSTLEIF